MDSTPTATAPVPPPRAAARFLKFGLVGASGVVVNVAILAFLVEFLAWRPATAAIVSIEASTLSNYLLNRAWTWRDRDRSWWSLLSYHAVALVGLVGQWATVWAGTTQLDVHYLVAALAGIAVSTAWNFLANHFVTFVDYTPERRRRHLRVALYAAAFLLNLSLAALLTHDWDTFVFQKSVEEFVVDGTTPYETGMEKPSYIYAGIGLPGGVQPLWYAYPPLPLLAMSATYAPVALGLPAAPWLARILIKVPFLAANIALAALAHRLLRTSGDAGPEALRKADRAERFLLFNPLFVMVAAVWGQFEGLLLAFLVGSFLYLRQGHHARAGLFFGLATLVKIFPLYLGPVLLVWIWRRSGFRSAFRYFAAGGAVFALVSLPFFLLQPQGYLEQVFLMHAKRQPGRFAPIAFLFESLREASRRFPGALPGDEGLVSVLSLLSFTLTVVVVLLLTLASSRHPANERNLFLWAGLSMLGGLLCTKVVSEQYVILPLGLLALYHWHSETPAIFDPKRMGRLLGLTTVFVSFAAAIDSAHFLMFLPEDVAHRLLGRSVPEAILFLAQVFHLSVGKFRLALGLVAAVGLIVPLYLCVRSLAPALRDGLLVIARGLEPLKRLVPSHPRMHAAAFATAFLVLVLTPSVAVGVFSPKREAAPDDAGVIQDRFLLAHYRTDWFNPTNRLEVPGGVWSSTTLTPEDGYYNSFAHKISEDIDLIRDYGFDGLLISSDPVFEHHAFAAARVAEERGFPYALEVDLTDLAGDDGLVSINGDTSTQARALFNGPFVGFWDREYHLRLSAEGGHTIFVSGAGLVQPTFTDSERRHVADVLAEAIGKSRVQAMEQAAGVKLWRLAPTSVAALDAPEAGLWREAYTRAEADWWEEAFAIGDNETRFDIVVDEDPGFLLDEEGHVRIVGRYVSPRLYAQGAGAPASSEALLVDLAAADPRNLEAYDATWERILSAPPSGVLVPWNDFDLGLGIEPTMQGGPQLLERTLDWGARFRTDAAVPDGSE